MNNTSKESKKPWARILQKLMGSRLYRDLKAYLFFRSPDSPFPLYPHTPFEAKWDRFLDKPYGRTRIGAAYQPLVYIVSPTQRSGTNFLGNLLERHPDLQAPYNSDLPMEQCLYSYSQFIKTYCYKTVSTWKKWVKGGDAALEKHTKMIMGHMGNGILNYFNEFIQPGRTLLMKTPDAGNLDNFFHLFPNGKVIILVRDGRDTMESFARSWGGSGAFGKMSKRWSQRVETILKFKKQADKAGFCDQYLIVEYEKLNKNTESELARIFDFLQIQPELYPWKDLDHVPILGSSAYKGDGKTVHWEPLEKTAEFKPNKKWVGWNKRKKAIFKANAGDNLVKLGFAENNDW